jgi:hypothetical protein
MPCRLQRTCDIDIDALSLVVQHGPERAWDWSIVSTIRLAAPPRTKP